MREPTADELQAAWRVLRGRPTWPATFAEAMRDPIFSGLLKLTARHPPRSARAAAPAPAHAPAAAPAVQRRAAPSRMPLPRQAALAFDRKRAAAGERDDD